MPLDSRGVAFNLGGKAVTFKASTAVAALYDKTKQDGLPAIVTANGTVYHGCVALTAAQTAGYPGTGTVDRPLGLITSLDSDGYVAVQMSGVIVAPYDDGTHHNTVTVGNPVNVDEFGLLKDAAVLANGAAAKTVGCGICIDLDSTNKLATVVMPWSIIY